MKKVGIVGLGLMGTAMAERLVEHGYEVHLWNRTPEKATSLIQLGARWSENPFAICDQVIISLYSSAIVAQVIGNMSPQIRQSHLIIDTTTGEPEDCIALGQRLAVQGARYLDAPISGSSEQTRRGEAMVMVGGMRSTFDECADLWKVLGKSVIYTGESGSASRMKLVTNLVLGLNRVALAEGLSFAHAIGVSPQAALHVLQASVAYSKVMDVKGEKMLTGDFRAQARLSQHLKDVRIILKSAMENELSLPLSETHRMLLEEAERLGLGELDNSSIIGVYQRRNDE